MYGLFGHQICFKYAPFGHNDTQSAAVAEVVSSICSIHKTDLKFGICALESPSTIWMQCRIYIHNVWCSFKTAANLLSSESGSAVFESAHLGFAAGLAPGDLPLPSILWVFCETLWLTLPSCCCQRLFHWYVPFLTRKDKNCCTVEHLNFSQLGKKMSRSRRKDQSQNRVEYCESLLIQCVWKECGRDFKLEK